MRLLLVNFEINPKSRVLAWQYNVALKLSKHCEQIWVLTEYAVPCDLPNNVKLVVVPRPFIKLPWRWLGAKWLMNFAIGAIASKNSIDACFIHMNMEWAYRLAPVLKAYRIPVLMWYAHGTVSTRLKVAHWFVDRVVSSTLDGFRIPSTKLVIIGQGIDTDVFKIPADHNPENDILYVGRFSRRKRIDLLLETMKCLTADSDSRNKPVRLLLIGSALSKDDQAYEKEMLGYIHQNRLESVVVFVGQLAPEQIPYYYRHAFLHLNVSETGSLDKTLMESLACGCPVLTSNEAFINLFGKSHTEFVLNETRPSEIARRILELHTKSMPDPMVLRSLVIGQHDLSGYIAQIINQLSTLTK